MERFDKNFNDVDSITSRPFSAGHPDGIWIGSIVYGFTIAVPLFVIIALSGIAIFTGGLNLNLLVKMAIALTINSFLFSPPIIFGFRRSKFALEYSVFLLALFLLGTVTAYLFQPEAVFAPLAIACLQGYNCYYLLGLKKDSLIT